MKFGMTIEYLKCRKDLNQGWPDLNQAIKVTKSDFFDFFDF